MTDYPNREHQVAVQSAHRRALRNLETIKSLGAALTSRLNAGHPVDGSEARGIAEANIRLTENLQILETLREVREWHSADLADLQDQMNAADHGEPGEEMYRRGIAAAITRLGGKIKVPAGGWKSAR